MTPTTRPPAPTVAVARAHVAQALEATRRATRRPGERKATATLERELGPAGVAGLALAMPGGPAGQEVRRLMQTTEAGLEATLALLVGLGEMLGEGARGTWAPSPAGPVGDALDMGELARASRCLADGVAVLDAVVKRALERDPEALALAVPAGQEVAAAIMAAAGVLVGVAGLAVQHGPETEAALLRGERGEG